MFDDREAIWGRILNPQFMANRYGTQTSAHNLCEKILSRGRD